MPGSTHISWWCILYELSRVGIGNEGTYYIGILFPYSPLRTSKLNKNGRSLGDFKRKVGEMPAESCAKVAVGGPVNIFAWLYNDTVQ